MSEYAFAFTNVGNPPDAYVYNIYDPAIADYTIALARATFCGGSEAEDHLFWSWVLGQCSAEMRAYYMRVYRNAYDDESDLRDGMMP